MVLFMFLAQLYGAVQLFVISSASRTVRWRTILFAFIAGMSASAFTALLIEFTGAHIFAAITQQDFSSVTANASYTVDPFVEEICKVLPFLLILLIPRVRRQLGIGDYVIICAALGAGFGLTENIFRFSQSMSDAQLTDVGYWCSSLSLSFACVPDPGTTLASWLPVGAMVTSFFSTSASMGGPNLHLIWSSLVGLSLGLLLRGRGRWKWTAVLPFLLAGLEHVGTNAVALAVSWPDFVTSLFTFSAQLGAIYPLVALGVAIWLDHLSITRALANEPGLRFQGGQQRYLVLFSALVNTPAVLFRFWSFILQRRAFALQKAITPNAPSLARTRSRLTLLCSTFAGSKTQPLTGSFPPNRGATRKRVTQPRVRFTPQSVSLLLLAVPPLLYFVIGNFSATAGLQSALATPIIFPALIIVLAAAIIWQGILLVRKALKLPQIIKRGSQQAILVSVFGSLTTLAGIGFGAISVVAALTNYGPLQPMNSFAHIIDAFGSSTLLALALFALLLLLLGGGVIALIGEGIAEAAAEGIAEGAAEALEEMAAEASFEAGEGAATVGETAAEEAATEAQSAVESLENVPNDINHVFNNPGHNWNLTGLDQQGNLNLLQDTLQNGYGQIPDDGLYQVTQNFGDYTVTVRGFVVDGVLRIGSAWVNAI